MCEEKRFGPSSEPCGTPLLTWTRLRHPETSHV